MNEYQQQAADFLAKHGITFSFKLEDKKLPPWRESEVRQNNHFIVTLKRGDKKISFDFFGSQKDYMDGNDEIDAYTVLACCRNAEKLHKAYLKQSQKLQSFFDGEEMVENLMEIA